jgi:hypothetical protein
VRSTVDRLVCNALIMSSSFQPICRAESGHASFCALIFTQIYEQLLGASNFDLVLFPGMSDSPDG